MRCVIDLRNAGCRIGTVRGRAVSWSSVPDHRKSFMAFAKALRAMGRATPITHVGVTVRRADSEFPPFATWSVMRGAAAIGNSLAFAKGAKVIEILVNGDESDAELLRAFAAACNVRRGAAWTVPAYGGEPNITKPRSA